MHLLKFKYLDDVTPSVIARKKCSKMIFGRHKKGIVPIEERNGALLSLTGLSVKLTFKEALKILLNNRKRVDAFEKLRNELRREYRLKIGYNLNKYDYGRQ